MGRLSPLRIRHLREPGRYSDGDGLYLELTGPQKGNWQLRAIVNGRRRDIGPGSLALVSLKEARDAAFELRREIQRGIDPIAERRHRKLEILTFSNSHARSFRTEGPLIREVLLPIWLDKPDTARRVKQRIGVVLDWAYASGMRSSV